MSLSGLFARIYSDIVNDKLSIPAMPDVVLRLQKMIRSDNYTMETLARAVQVDIGLSAYLVNIANSPLYRTRVKAVDVESAIRVIGVKAFTNLVNGYAIHSLVDKRELKTRPMLRKIWQASAYRAAIAGAISRQVESVDENRALLAGLLQDVGLLPVLMKAPAQDLPAEADEPALAELQKYGARVGAVIASQWKLDDELAEVIRNSGNFAYPGGESIDLVDVTNIARLLSQIGNKQMQWPRLDQAPCLRRFGEEGLTYENALALIKQAREDIHAISRVLVGNFQ